MKWTVEFTHEEVCQKLKELAISTLRPEGPAVRVDSVKVEPYGNSKVILTDEPKETEE